VTVGEPNVRTDYLQVDVRAYSADDVTILARADLAPGLQHIRAAVKSDGLD
jgi:hypothetical protein